MMVEEQPRVSDRIDWVDIESRVARGEINSNEVGAALRKLSEIVANRHYSRVPAQTKEDIISEGVVKGMALLEEGRFDRNITSLKNYLYTGMRNQQQNFLFRSRKEIPSEDEVIPQKDMCSRSGEIVIRYEEIRNTVQKFDNCYMKYLNPLTKRLLDMGFVVSHLPESFEKSVARLPILNDTVVEQFTCLVIWHKVEDCLW